MAVKKKQKPGGRKVSAVPSIVQGEGSASIRKIQNGFLVRVSKSTRDRFIEKEFYAKTAKEAKEIVGRSL